MANRSVTTTYSRRPPASASALLRPLAAAEPQRRPRRMSGQFRDRFVLVVASGGSVTQRNGIRTLIFLVICGLSAITAAAVGIDDNLPGVLLAFLAATAFVLAFVHPWRTPGQFRRLLYASASGFVGFGLLHNVFEAIAPSSGGSGSLYDLLSGAAAVLFLLAMLVCPSGMLVGAVGAVVLSIRNRRHPASGPATAT